MEHSKTLRLLRAMSRRERSLFRSWLPLLAGRQAARLAAAADLMEPAASGAAPPPSREAVYASAFGPGSTYDDKQLRYLLADFNQACKAFLGWLAWTRDPHAQYRAAIQAFGQRGLEQELMHEPVPPGEQPIDRMLRVQLLHTYWPAGSGREAQAPGADAMTALDEVFLLSKLRDACGLLSRANVFAGEPDIRLLDAALEEASGPAYSSHTLIQVYLAGVRMLQPAPEPGAAARLRQLLDTAGPAIPESEQRNLYAMLLNAAIKRLNQGEAGAGQEVFSLYAILLERNLLLENGFLPASHFKNIVAIGVRLREFSRTETFIGTYSRQLPPGEQESAQAYNLAYLAFAQGAYRQVLRLLSRSDWSDPYYQLDARVLLLKTCYELQDFEAVEYHLGSLRIFLRRQRRISAYQLRLFQHLSAAMQQLLRCQAGSGSPERLLRYLADHPDTASVGWLQEKA
ncbi:MAG: hypothetical protein NW241_15210, partial [Bacteroidia bacterium]|nr:hypothetical protein [Bacteroidia bacterium]